MERGAFVVMLTHNRYVISFAWRAMDSAASSMFWFSPELEACVHVYRYPQGGLDSFAHTHDEYNFLFCLEPPLRYEVRGQIWDVGTGDCIVINPGELHRGLQTPAHERACGLTVHFSAQELTRLVHRMRLPVDAESNRLVFHEQIHIPEIVPALEELRAEIGSTRSGSDLVAQSLLMQIMVMLLRKALTPRVLPGKVRLPKQLPSWQMVCALEYMNSRGKSDFNLPELCAATRSSVSRLIPLFKNSCGDVSPSAFHNRLLVRKAERLLAATGYPIKEISLELGFQNESHFCRTFRLLKGESPGVYRMRRNGMF